LKRHMGNFATWAERDPNASGPYDVSIRKEKHTIDNVVDVFKFTSGTIRSMPSFNLARDVSTVPTADPLRSAEYGTAEATPYTHMSGLLLNVQDWRWVDKFSIEHVPGKDNGEGANGFYRIMTGLQCDNPKVSAHIYIADPAHPDYVPPTPPGP